MCGRVIQASPPDQLGLKIIDALDPRDNRVTRDPFGNVPPRYNGAPSQQLWVIRQNPQTGERSLDLLRWGLIPYWCKDKPKPPPINAKAETVIEPGAVNWMQAGRGIVHSERTSPERRRTGQRLFGIQTWMALPEEQEESDPAFVHHSSGELPMIDTNGIRARVIAGEAFGASSPLQTASETLYADVHLTAAAQLPVDPTYEERAIYTIAGEIDVAGSVFGPSQLLV